MLGRVSAIVIWIACYYYDLWNIIPKNEHSTLGIGLFLLFLFGDGSFITFKKIIEKRINQTETGEDG